MTLAVFIQRADFSIRPVRPDELDSVLEVYRQCEDFLALGPVAAASMAMVLADLDLSRAEGGVYCGIFSPAGEMLGVFDFILSGYAGDPQAAYLSLLMIAAPHRGQGLGRAVVAAVEEEICRDLRITAICAGVQVNNLPGVRFWQRCGYRVVSGPKLLPDQTTVFDLRKDILPAL